MALRDPLVIVYRTLRKAVKTVHGEDFIVRDESPDPTEFNKQKPDITYSPAKEQLPASNLTYVSGVVEKALMREYTDHGTIDNEDATWTVGTEAVRFEYMFQVSFFAARKGVVQSLMNQFISYVELENEIPIPEDKWETSMQIFLESPPLPPMGEPDLYQCDATFTCRGKLILEQTVESIDITNFRPVINN